MEDRFTPSINILRDLNKSFDYIQTPNAERVFKHLDNNYSTGIHSFNIIGSFGTGKSSFLLAFEKQLRGEKKFFDFPPKSLNGHQSTQCINLIGSYRSIEDAFSEALGSKTGSRDVLEELDVYYNKVRGKNQRLVIIVDEFGKFLEYAAANNPEKELYFVQLLCEYANDVNKDILFITTLHQNFQAYTTDLSIKQRQEWEKVKGRFKEITFNEPVEQLLLLASRHLQKEKCVTPTGYQELIGAIANSNAFPSTNQLDDGLVRNLLPLEPLSASVLTLALQKYGQNERSLFSFLKSNDLDGLNDFEESSNPYYNLNCVYDYLIHNFYALLTTRYNPDYTQWAAIRSSLERVEVDFEKNLSDAVKLVKAIGLLNIFSSKGAKIEHSFLSQYARLSLGIDDPETLIRELVAKKIIRFQEFKSTFILFEGTDLDIELAVQEAASYVDPPLDFSPILNEYFRFPYILAKAVFYKKGTPRYFQVIFSNHPVVDTSIGLVDGFVNLIFSETIDPETVQDASTECQEAILYGLYQKPVELKKIIWEIEKTKFALSQNLDDRVAVRELKLQVSHLINQMNQKVLSAFNTSSDDMNWFFNGKREILKSRKQFNGLLSEICEKIYPETPVYRNELVNRHKVSSSIPVARKSLFRKLVKHWQDEDLNFPPQNYPPEKTIYLTLLKETQIHRRDEDGYMILAAPENDSFNALWHRCEAFLESAADSKKGVGELFQILSEKPFKLKKGFLEFWVPIFLYIKRDSFALFFEDVYVPYLTAESLTLIERDPDKHSIKMFQIEGIRMDLFNKYRRMLSKETTQKLSNISFIDTISPFLGFYKGLPEYTRKTKRLSPSASALMDAIANAKEPEKTFFEDFPSAFGYSISRLTKSEKDMEMYFNHLRQGLAEIKNCFDELLKRILNFLKQELNLDGQAYPQYKRSLQQRFKGLKTHLLLNHHRSFYNRLNSEVEDEYAWLKSIIHSVLGKPLETIEDSEEERVNENFLRMIAELDNMCDLSRLKIDSEKEEAIKIEITSLTEGLNTRTIRLPKNKMVAGASLKTEIEKKLTGDKQANIAALLSLLKEQLENE